jgi:hypothetical protein
MADMPDAGSTRKRQIRLGRTSENHLNTKGLPQAAMARWAPSARRNVANGTSAADLKSRTHSL